MKIDYQILKEIDTENDLYDSESSESYISEEVVNNEPEIEYNKEERNFSQLNDEQKDEFKKLKILNDYKNKTMTDRYRNSTEKIGNTTENEKVPTLNELKEMNLEEIPFHMLDEQTQRLKRMEKYAEILL